MAQLITQNIANSQSFSTMALSTAPIDADIPARLQYFMNIANFILLSLSKRECNL